MTLIVAVRCADGIVVGADGAATFGVPGQFNTIRQPVRKLRILHNRIIIGTSGPVGIGQRLADEVDFLWSKRELTGKRPEEAMSILRRAFFEKHLGPELQAAGVAKAVIGSAANASALSQSVLAMPLNGKLCLFQFDAQGAPEMATTDLPFVSIGSGQPIADPFLAFLRRALWRHQGDANDPVPPLGDGILAALWTLVHAIETNPGGVADPIQMMILREEGKEMTARELTDAELGEHKQVIKDIEREIGEYWNKFRSAPKNSDVVPVPQPEKK